MQSLAGHFLIASPELEDPNFAKTIVLMVRHDADGALGLVLNRPTETTLGDAWQQVSDRPCSREEFLYHGGPCDGPLMLLHNDPNASQVEVVSGIHFTVEKEHAEKLIARATGQLRVFVGHAGWSPGQLEGEIETGSWFARPATQDLVFGRDEGLWRNIVGCIGIEAMFPELDPRRIPPDPTVN